MVETLAGMLDPEIRLPAKTSMRIGSTAHALTAWAEWGTTLDRYTGFTQFFG